MEGMKSKAVTLLFIQGYINVALVCCSNGYPDAEYLQRLEAELKTIGIEQ